MFWQLDSLIEHMFDLTDEEKAPYYLLDTPV